jgi:hypothetical protein
LNDLLGCASGMTLDQPLSIALRDAEGILPVVMSRALCREAVA